MGPLARWSHALAFDANRGAVVLFGGLAAAPTDPNVAASVLGDTWEAPFDKPVPAVVSFALSPDTISAGVAAPQPVSVQIGLDRPALPGGFFTDVQLDGPGVAGGPVGLGSLVVAAGDTTATQSFGISGPLPAGDAVVEAQYAGGFVAAQLHIA